MGSWGLGFRVKGLRFWAQGFGFWVLGSGVYPLSACLASSRHLAKMSTLACSKDLKISSHLDVFKQDLELTAKSRGPTLSDLKKDEI